MTIQITKASDDKYSETREIKSLDDLCKIAHEFKDQSEDWDAPLILWFYDDKPFRFIAQVYDDYIE